MLNYLPFIHDFVQLSLVSTIIVPMHFAILSENILIDLFLEFLLLHEIIFSSMHLPLPWPSRCVADA